MSKNRGAGGRNGSRGGKNELAKREIDLKDVVGQEYGQVLKLLGTDRVEVHCFDGKQRDCHIRGTMCKNVWITVGDIVLVGLRDFQDYKGDVISKYTPYEVRKLKRDGIIPDDVEFKDDEVQFTYTASQENRVARPRPEQ